MTNVRKILALVRATWLHIASYRMQSVLSFAGLFLGVLPIYFISRALQPTMGGAIQGQGGQYFAFLIVGMGTYACIATAVGALHASLSSEIRSGGLEALLATPTPLSVIAVGMTGQAFSVTAVRLVLLVVAASLLGAKFVWSATAIALVILLLLVVAYAGLGAMAAALVLAFKTPGPVPTLILGLSAVFGGVYYPIHVMPAWLQFMAQLMPLTYGLRAMRQALLEGAPVTAVLPDVAVVAAIAVALVGTGMLVFQRAVRYARAAGSLAQY